MPTADDFDDPDGFVRGRPELDISDLESPEKQAGTSAAGQEGGPAEGQEGESAPDDDTGKKDPPADA
jgi:hypothetical protein